jgi:hypothetical protein
MITPIVRQTLLCGLAGAVFAKVYFSGLSWNVQLYVDEGIGLRAGAVHVGRLLLAASMFTLCAMIGAAPLLASFAAFLAMRLIILRRFTLADEVPR